MRQLKSYRSRLWRVRLFEVLLALTINVGLAYLLMYLSDRVWDGGAVVRWSVFFFSFASLVLFSPYWITRWIVLKRTPIQLARQLERHLPSLGDKLRGIIELSAAADRPDNTSPLLREAAIRQVASQLSDEDLSRHVSVRNVKTGLFALIVIVGAIAASCMADIEAAWNSLVRAVSPWSHTERYTFAQFEMMPGELIVPLGESVSLTMALSPHSRMKPDEGRYRLDSGRWIDVPRRDGTLVFEIDLPPLQQPARLRWKSGDADRELSIIPRPRPALQRAFAEVKLPDYIGEILPDVPVRAGVVSVLKDSVVRLTAVATHDLANGKVTEPEGVLSIDGNRAVFPALTVGDESRDLSYHWVDHDGLVNAREMQIRLEPADDRQPSVRMESLHEDHFVLANTSIELELEASDDYGLSELGIAWDGEATAADQPIASTGKGEGGGATSSEEKVVLKGKRTESRLKTVFLFQADQLGITPQRLSLRAFANDYLPGRKRVYSEPLILHVLTPEEHANMIREQIDKLASRLEDMIRSMDEMGESADRLLDPKSDSRTDSSDTIRTLADEERENLSRLEELIDQQGKIIKSASRNPAIAPDVMKRMMRAMQNMEATSAGSLSQASEHFDKSAQGDASSRAELRQAQAAHQQAAEELKKALDQISESKQQMEAATFAARLKFAARQEDMIVSSMASFLGELAGLRLSDMNSDQKKVIDEIGSTQQSNNRMVGWIVDELNQYRTRNVEAIYDELYKEMEEKEITGRMLAVSESIMESHLGISIDQAAVCSELLKRWAGLLGGAGDSGGGGGGGCSDDDTISDEDLEFLLKIMRMIQHQQDIRMRTRSVEDAKRQQQ